MPEKLPQREFDEIYSRVPRLTVDLVIETQEGILLTLRDIPPMKGCWHFPGGTVLLGESVEEAVKRIAKDEVGLDVSVVSLLGFLECNQLDDPFFHAVSLVHLIKIERGEVSLNYMARDARFFEKMPPKILPVHKKFVGSIPNLRKYIV